MAECVAAALRMACLWRGMTEADLVAAWEQARSSSVGVATWRRRLTSALADRPVPRVVLDDLDRVLRASPKLRSVVHLVPDLTGWDGGRVTFLPGLLRTAVEERGWTLDSLATYAGLGDTGRRDVRRGLPLRSDDAARLLRLLAGHVPERARPAELDYIDRHQDPLDHVDVPAAFAGRGWTAAAAARAAGLSPATAGTVLRGRGSWTSRAAVRDAIQRTPSLPPPPSPPPDPAPPLDPLPLRHEMHWRALDITAMAAAAEITPARLTSALRGAAMRRTWMAIHRTLADVPPVKGADDFLAPAEVALGRWAAPRLDPARVANRLRRLAMSPGDFRLATGLVTQVAVDARSGRGITPATLLRCLEILTRPAALRWAHDHERADHRRLQIGWDDEELARQAGLGKTTVYCFLRGTPVSAATRRRIEAALGSPAARKAAAATAARDREWRQQLRDWGTVR